MNGFIPAKCPFPIGRSSCAQLAPGDVYQRPLPESGKPIGVKRVIHVQVETARRQDICWNQN